MKSVEVLLTGKLYVEVNYSSVISVEVEDDATEDDIIEMAQRENTATSEICNFVHKVLNENEEIDEIDISGGEEEFEVEEEED